MNTKIASASVAAFVFAVAVLTHFKLEAFDWRDSAVKVSILSILPSVLAACLAVGTGAVKVVLP